jgi:hypothetical protein
MDESPVKKQRPAPALGYLRPSQLLYVMVGVMVGAAWNTVMPGGAGSVGAAVAVPKPQPPLRLVVLSPAAEVRVVVPPDPEDKTKKVRSIAACRGWRVSVSVVLRPVCNTSLWITTAVATPLLWMPGRLRQCTWGSQESVPRHSVPAAAAAKACEGAAQHPRRCAAGLRHLGQQDAAAVGVPRYVPGRDRRCSY